MCKVMEHIIPSNAVEHLAPNSLIYDLQHGFRERLSCKTQLLSLIENLAHKISRRKQTDLILLDFSKAFDKVNHSVTLEATFIRNKECHSALDQNLPLVIAVEGCY